MKGARCSIHAARNELKASIDARQMLSTIIAAKDHLAQTWILTQQLHLPSATCSMSAVVKGLILKKKRLYANVFMRAITRRSYCVKKKKNREKEKKINICDIQLYTWYFRSHYFHFCHPLTYLKDFLFAQE